MDNLAGQIGTTLEASGGGVMKGDMDCVLGGKDPLQEFLLVHFEGLGHLSDIPLALRQKDCFQTLPEETWNLVFFSIHALFNY
jgi:hypothetical protein